MNNLAGAFSDPGFQPAKKMTFAEIFADAEQAAKEAGERHEASLPDPNRRGFDCGFAWVWVPDGRSDFIKWCRSNGKGDKHHRKGWEFWCTGYVPRSQSISTHEAAARAFADVLTKNGVECQVGSRLD